MAKKALRLQVNIHLPHHIMTMVNSWPDLEAAKDWAWKEAHGENVLLWKKIVISTIDAKPQILASRLKGKEWK